MRELLSIRLRNSQEEPEVYKYDEFSDAFRNQIFFILKDILEPYENNDESMWDILHDMFSREKGLKKLGCSRQGSYEYGKENIEEYITRSSNEDFLDFIDFVFYYADSLLRKITPQYDTWFDSNRSINNAILELNHRFKQHRLGYEFLNGEVIRIDNTFIHKEVIKPVLKILNEEAFLGAEEELLKAFEYRRNDDNKNAILEAGKAFESTMKTICEKKGYCYDKNNDTAKKLINILESNHFYPSYMSTHLSNVRLTLETGVPVVRNKNSGHGQGSDIIDIPDELVDYAINLAATNILFLLKLYKNNK